MPKINLATVTSPLNSTEFQRQINENFTKVSESLDKQLQRESQNGVVNYMEDVIDMGSNRIINLAKAVDPTDAMRKKEFDEAAGNIEQWAEEAKTSAANAKISETNAEAAKVIAVSAANSAEDHEEDCQTILDSVETLKEEIITNPSVETVAESITDVNIVAGRIDDVSLVAENVETVVDAKNKVIDLATRISFGNLGDVQATTSLVAPKGCEFLDGHVITKEAYPQAFIALEEGRLPSRSKAEYKAAAGTVSGLDFSVIDTSNFGGRYTVRSNNTKADIIFNLEQGFHGYVDLGIKVPNNTTHYELAIGGLDFNKNVARGLLAETPLGTVFYEDGVIKYFPKFMLPNGSQMQESAWTTIEPTWASSGMAYVSFKIVWDSNELPYMEVYSNHTPSEDTYVGACRWDEDTYGSFETHSRFPWSDMKVWPNEAVIIGAYGNFTAPAMYSYYGHRIWVNGEVAYQEIFTPENSYPFFGYDAGSSTAYLPIAWDIFIEASDTHAAIVEPGLPDHTHNMFADITIGSDGNLASSTIQVAKGTSSGNGNYEYTLKQTNTAATLGRTSLASGSIYGGSTTVQPHALRYRHYIVLAEGATLAYTNRPSVATYSALPTTGNVLGDLRGVLDTNISYVWVKFGENQYGWSSLGYGIGVTEQRLQETVGDIETALASV